MEPVIIYFFDGFMSLECMNYQSAKANWFPTQSVASQFLVRSYTKTVGLYDSSYRYLIFNKPEKYQNDCVIGLGYHPLFNHTAKYIL